MVDLNTLSPQALAAAMKSGTDGWGKWGGANHHALYVEPIHGNRRRCRCGCRKRVTYRLMANGVCLSSGCELAMRRLARP